MSAYVIFCMSEVTDMSALERYRVAARPTMAAHGPRVHCGPAIAETLEGAPFGAALVMEFDSIAAAHAWYDSPDYQAAKAIRETGTKMHTFIVEGR